MISAPRSPVLAIAFPLVALFATMALAQAPKPDPSAPTTLEEALIEHVCSKAHAPESPGFHDCLSTELLSLREEFGRDLSRLAAPDRKAVDSACSGIRTAVGRDAYLDCLNGQLTAVRARRRRASPAASSTTALPEPPASDPPATPAPVLVVDSSWSSTLWIGATVATLFAAVGGGLWAAKARRVRRKCRVCGNEVPESGDLCPTCRHEAAEALRHAAAERAEQERAQETEQRRLREREEEQRRDKPRREEDARLRQEEEARQREQHARELQEEEARQRAGSARQQQSEAHLGDPAGVVSDDAFDPYEVLGVARDASKEAIEAAYRAAKAKYTSDLVAHLGVDLQEHFRVKEQAVDRAYKTITESQS